MPATRQRQEQGRKSREKLLRAVTELLGERGYSEVSVELVLRRAGVARSALYWNFGSKNGLIVAALERETQGWVTDVRAAVDACSGPGEKLDTLLDHIRQAVERPQQRAMVFSLLLERGRKDPEVREAIFRAFGELRQALAAGLVDAVSGLDPQSATAIANAFVDTADGMFIRSLVAPEGASVDSALSELRLTTQLRLAHAIASGRRNRADQGPTQRKRRST